MTLNRADNHPGESTALRACTGRALALGDKHLHSTYRNVHRGRDRHLTNTQMRLSSAEREKAAVKSQLLGLRNDAPQEDCLDVHGQWHARWARKKNNGDKIQSLFALGSAVKCVHG